MKKLLTLLCLSSLICMASPGRCSKCGYFSKMPYENGGKKYCSDCYFKYDIYKQHDSNGDWIEFFIVVGGLVGGIIVCYNFFVKNKSTDNQQN